MRTIVFPYSLINVQFQQVLQYQILLFSLQFSAKMHTNVYRFTNIHIIYVFILNYTKCFSFTKNICVDKRIKMLLTLQKH